MHYNKMYVHNASFPENSICPVHPTLTVAAVVAQNRHFHHVVLLVVLLVDLLDHLAGFLVGHLGFRHVGSCRIVPENWIEIRIVTDEKLKVIGYPGLHSKMFGLFLDYIKIENFRTSKLSELSENFSVRKFNCPKVFDFNVPQFLLNTEKTFALPSLPN